MVVNQGLTEDDVDCGAQALADEAHVFDIFEVHEGADLADDLGRDFVYGLGGRRDLIVAVALSGVVLGGIELLAQGLVSHGA